MPTIKTKTYHMRVEIDLIVKEQALVAHNPDSLAAALRHALRTYMPTRNFTSGGYKVDANTVHAELIKEDADV